MEIYSDGSCLKNPGQGAFGAILISFQSMVVITGFNTDTTNNQMELLAPIEALNYLINKEVPERITINTDSQYVKNGIQDWIFNWKKNNWRTANGSPVKNQDLWKVLYDLNMKIKPHWNWVRGHSDNKYNNIVDFIANYVARNQRVFEDINILTNKFPEISKYQVEFIRISI